MANTGLRWNNVAQRDFSRGIHLYSTNPPEGSVQDSRDFFWSGEALCKRGSGSITNRVAAAAAHYPVAAINAEFIAGDQLLAVTDDGKLNTVGSSATLLKDMGSAWASKQNPVFSIIGTNQKVVIPANNGTSVPYVYVGSGTPAALGGSPPPAKYACIHLSRVILANSTANANRVWFSPVPDIESAWDTTNSWIDADAEVIGVASVGGALLVFCKRHLEKIIGDTPPGSGTSNMSRSRIGTVGCVDARSIVVHGNLCYFASTTGVWVTDGVTLKSIEDNRLVQRGTIAYGYSTTPTTGAVLGMHGNRYLFGGRASTDLRVFYDAADDSWWKATYPTTITCAVEVNGVLLCGTSTLTSLIDLTTYLSPTAQSLVEVDGSTAIKPSLTTKYFGDMDTFRAFGRGHITYWLRDDGATDPGLTVFCNSGAASGTAVPESPLPDSGTGANALSRRRSISINRDGLLQQIQLITTASATEFRLYGIEMEMRDYFPQADGSR